VQTVVDDHESRACVDARETLAFEVQHGVEAKEIHAKENALGH
jgi:hypothetical protein